MIINWKLLFVLICGEIVKFHNFVCFCNFKHHDKTFKAGHDKGRRFVCEMRSANCHQGENHLVSDTRQKPDKCISTLMDHS